MASQSEGTSAPKEGVLRAERLGEREMRVMRLFKAGRAAVYDAWTTPDMMLQWWSPQSSPAKLISCQMDVRTGGSYRLTFQLPDGRELSFFGSYIEARENEHLVWTNEESSDGAMTTLDLADHDGATLLTYSEVYPSKEALDESFDGMCAGMAEQFGQLDALLAGEA